ncbi:MAG: hypothetical protein ACOC8F_03830 [Planctomycetota bacterium]
MADFPRTEIDGLSVPRMLIGTNWFLGFSHTSQAKDAFIKRTMDRRVIADVLEVFLSAGVDAIYGVRPEAPHLIEAIRDAEDRTGRRCVRIGTPHLNTGPTDDADDENERTLDAYAELGCDICGPHQCTTDALADRRSRTIRGGEAICARIRERGMIPMLSTHAPEVPIYADETDLDVGTYIQLYNAVGFLMQIEVDWVQRMIWQRKRPVIAIKPFAAGRVHPLVGLAFCYATLRPCDMVCVGTMTPDEARELIEIAAALFEGRCPDHELQRTRSKTGLDGG